MSRGKHGVSSANRRAAEADNSATHWRKRALEAEAEARGYKRGAALHAHRADALAVELEKAEADRDAAASDETRRLSEKLAAESEKLHALVALIIEGDREGLAFSAEEWAKIRRLVGPDAFEQMIASCRAGTTRTSRRNARRSPRVIEQIIGEGRVDD